MRHLSISMAAVCVVALLAPKAWAQTPSPVETTQMPPTPSAPSAPSAPPAPPDTAPEPIRLPELEPPSDVPTEIPDARESEPRNAGVASARPTTSGPAPATIWWDIGYRYPGTYSTTHLLSLLDALERAGLKREAVRRAAGPFIIAGYARFWDSWGEVRHADSGLRPHLGQDVFCNYGAPVVASESGTLEYGQDPSGGLVARIHRGDGSYWYYAHLSRFASARSSGERVHPGEVIGYCGTSGNAAGTPPHVHFSFFVNHVAQNPMGALISWLDAAESRATKMLKKLNRRVPEKQPPVLKLPLEDPQSAVPGPRCYAPLPGEPLELALLVMEDL